VLANLPYVPEGAPLQPEIARFEPGEALFAGPDGLDVIRRMVVAAEGVRLLALEIGPEQADPTAELLRSRGFRTEMIRDLAGHPRVIVGRR
jgi:release factor glutamine methyltransferase